MSSAASGEERARLFVALELPDAVRGALVGWRPSVEGLRPISPDDLHVTLCFLGWRLMGEVKVILAACSEALQGVAAMSLALGEAVWLPPRRPRVLAAGLSDEAGGLACVQGRLSGALSEGGWYEPEARPFYSHVTVARVAKGARVRAVELPAPAALTFAGSRVTLFRSRLSARGARYEPLGTVELVDSEDPLDVVRRFHAEQARAYALGELEGVAALLCDDVVWHVPGESAIAGEHRGRDAVLSYMMRRRSLTDASFRVHVHGMALIDGRVVQLAGGVAARDGHPVAWETVGVFSVRAGQIASCRLIPFDLAAFDAIWA